MTSAPPHPRPYSAYSFTLLACALVYFPRLGATGFSYTEGHRVIPAWEMLSSRDFLVPRLFGQAYLRKPPGMPWAIAGSSAIFGETEFAARLASAISVTLLCLLCAHTAHRWFARPHPTSDIRHPTSRPALWSGLAAALLPLFWTIGRTAEIEALNTLGAAGSVIFLLELLLAPTAPLVRQLRALLIATGFIAIALFAKGPAALPAIASAIAAACIVSRSGKPLARPALWLALLIPAALFGFYVLRVRAALSASHETPVLQGPSDFLWSTATFSLSRLGKVAVMPAAALLSALPASLSLLTPLRRSEGSSTTTGAPFAAALALTTLLSLGLFTLLGVDNPRYAIPALGFLPILVGYAACQLPRFATPRALGAATALLAAGAALFIFGYEPRSRSTSGRVIGEDIAHALPDGAEVRADGLIEARPEVLLYAQRAAALDHHTLKVRWVPHLAQSAALPPPGSYLLLRTDPQGDEAASLAHAGLLARLAPIASGGVHKYTFTLYRVLP